MPPDSGSPFKPASAVKRRVKTLWYGDTGTGKTFAGLNCPGPVAVIDTEGGTDMYAGMFEFTVLHSKTHREVIAALDYIEKHPGEIGTLVIDPVTVLYETLQDAALIVRTKKSAAKAARAQASFDADDVDLEMLDWGRIKRAYKALMNRLVNLPCHVVVTAREKDITEKRGNDMVKVGTRPDAEKGTAYYFDVVMRFTKRGNGDAIVREGIVEKARGVFGNVLPLGSRHLDPSFDGLFGSVLKGDRATNERAVPGDDAAAIADAEQMERVDAAVNARTSEARRTSSPPGRTSTARNAAPAPETPQGDQDAPAPEAAPGDVPAEPNATPEQAGTLATFLDLAGIDPDELRSKRSLPPFTEMPASKVVALIEWAKNRVPTAPPEATAEAA